MGIINGTNDMQGYSLLRNGHGGENQDLRRVSELSEATRGGWTGEVSWLLYRTHGLINSERLIRYYGRWIIVRQYAVQRSVRLQRSVGLLPDLIIQSAKGKPEFAFAASVMLIRQLPQIWAW